MNFINTIAAVVTGGAFGLGEATARALAAHGAEVALFDLNEELGPAIAADISGTFCKVDVTKRRNCGCRVYVRPGSSRAGARGRVTKPAVAPQFSRTPGDIGPTFLGLRVT